MEIFGPFLLSSIAGLSTCLGILFTYLPTKNNKRFICIALSFAMGVMILISIKELVPIPLKNILLSYKVLPALIIALIVPIIAFLIVFLSNKKFMKLI